MKMGIMRYAYLGNLPIKKIYYIGKEIKKGFYKNFLFFGEEEVERELSAEFWCQYFNNQTPSKFTPSIPQDIESTNTIYLYKKNGYKTKITWVQNYTNISIDIQDGQTSVILDSELDCITSYQNKALTLTIKNPKSSSLEVGKTYNLVINISNGEKSIEKNYNLKVIDEVIA